MDSGDVAAKGKNANGEDGSMLGTLPARFTAATWPTILAAPVQISLGVRLECVGNTYGQGDSQGHRVLRSRHE